MQPSQLICTRFLRVVVRRHGTFQPPRQIVHVGLLAKADHRRLNGQLREDIKSLLITGGQTSAAKSFHPCHTAVHLDDSRQSIFGSKLIAFADVRVGAVILGGANEIDTHFYGIAEDNSVSPAGRSSWLSPMGSTPKPVRLTRMPVLLKIE